MRKHKKTRQEKIIADLHRKLQFQRTSSGALEQYSIVQPALKPIVSSYTVPSVHTYTYLKSDLIKIFFLTCSILASQTILFFLLKHNIVSNFKLGF